MLPDIFTASNNGGLIVIAVLAAIIGGGVWLWMRGPGGKAKDGK